MPGLLQFVVAFDNPHATYFGGQTITGHVRMTLARSTPARGIELCFRGESKVRWEEKKTSKDDDGNRVQENEEHSAHELYFESRFFVLGGPTTEMLLQPGEHMYNFSMQLPSVLPSSFEGELGYVRYTLVAALVQRMPGNFSAKYAFTVLCPLDLNVEPNVQNPVAESDDKFLCCCCCQSGPITCTVQIPASGFTPGQEIPFSIELDNCSNTTVSSVHVSLFKVESFTVTRPNKQVRDKKNKVVQMVLNGVASNDKYSWTERLEVPSLPPSFLRHCSIIDVRYYLEIEVKIPGPHHNLVLKIPIVIGTIPLSTAAPASNVGGGLVGFAPAATAPPSYEDCMMGPVSIQDFGNHCDVQGIMNFAPRYPVYRYPAHV